MKYFWSALVIISMMVLTACSDDSPGIEPETQGTEITRFSFLISNNPSLDKDRYATIENDLIKGRLPREVNIEKMVASFEHNGAAVKIDNTTQISGESVNNFMGIQNYTVSTTDGKQRQYEVDMTYFTGLPIIYIETDNNQEINSKEDYFEGTISIEGGRYYSDFSSTSMKIRGRGNST